MVQQDTVRAKAAGVDNAVVISDDDGNQYRIVPSGDKLTVTKNGQPIGFGKRRVVAKTANYTLVDADMGTMFTNRGASGAVTFTLPDATVVGSGWWAEFFVVADQNLIVAGKPDDANVAFNDAAADSVGFSTASEKIGSSIRATSDGTGYLFQVMLGAETATPTVGT